MRKLVIAALMTAMPLIGAAPHALAAQPNNQACLGKDFSTYAQSFPPFGQLITTFEVGGVRIIDGGLGDEVQNHLAGNVPDSVLPNSCND